jgi:hypothetical protein
VWITGESVRRRRAACLVDEGEGRSSTSTEGVGGKLGGNWVVGNWVVEIRFRMR